MTRSLSRLIEILTSFSLRPNHAPWTLQGLDAISIYLADADTMTRSLTLRYLMQMCCVGEVLDLRKPNQVGQ